MQHVDILTLLETTGASDLVVSRSGAPITRSVRSVRLCESAETIPAADEDGLAIVAPRASAELVDYRLDVAVRLASDAGLAALALYGLEPVPVTTERLAARGDLVLLGLVAGADPGDLLVLLDRGLRPGASTALARLTDLERVLCGVIDESAAEILAVASGALLAPLELVGSTVAAPSGVVGGAVAARMTADAIERAGRAREAEADRRVRAASSALADVLGATGARGQAELEQVRRLGIAIEGLHRVALIRSAAEPRSVAAVEAAISVSRIAVELVQHRPGWLVAVAGDVAVVLRSGVDEGVSDSDLRRLIDEVVERSASGHPRHLHASIGTAHAGRDGVRRSHAEAASALALGPGPGPGDGPSIIVFDASGLLRLIAEWAPTPSGERILRAALAPLTALGPPRANVLIETLQVYLDHLGSNTAAARVLHLHPNAVAYRMRRIRGLLGSEINEPDERIMLQLACRTALAAAPGG